MGHDLGVSHGVALWQWQKQSQAGKSQAQRVEQPDGPRVRGQRRPSLAIPIAVLRVWDRHQRAGRDPESSHDRISDGQPTPGPNM